MLTSRKSFQSAPFLPISAAEMQNLGWDQCDFVLVTGDAYVDHSSFGAAVIGRSLEADGFRVGIIAQPDWKDPASLRILGKPRLGFLITSGNMDSMVNHYTAARKLRHNDAYTPGGLYGRRPDRALIVYSNLARTAYKNVPVILGGIEASLRRLAHYDYWSDKLRRSVLLDAKADILIYGMAERTVRKAAAMLADGTQAGTDPLPALRGLRGVVYKLTRRDLENDANRAVREILAGAAGSSREDPSMIEPEYPAGGPGSDQQGAAGSGSDQQAAAGPGSDQQGAAEPVAEVSGAAEPVVEGPVAEGSGAAEPVAEGPAGAGQDSFFPGKYRKLPSFEECSADKKAYARSFSLQLRNADPFSAAALVEPCGDQYVVHNPPDYPLSRDELDWVYELPYARKAHPAYAEAIPALEEVKFSLVSSRGCFGGCTFCALTFHQGRIVQGRSHKSLVNEAEQLTQDADFKGYIHDVGGPTANFRGPACDRQKTHGACPHRQCLFPEPCPQLQADHRDYMDLLRKVRELPAVRKVFIRSGVRFDYLLADESGGRRFLRELCEYHISGQLKVAPEHISDKVLSYMGKSNSSVYRQFMREYAEMNRQLDKKQYLVPYFIAAHPGAALEDAVALAEFCRDQHFIPQQVQEFYPTPGTVASCMYHTGIDPRSMEPLYVAKGDRERRMHKALLQFNLPENYQLVKEALERTGRDDLIGNGPGALISSASPGKSAVHAGRRKKNTEKPRGRKRPASGRGRHF